MYLPSISAYGDEILNSLFPEEVAYLLTIKEDQLPGFHLTWGMDIRNECGLWNKNHPLTAHWHNFPEERDLRDDVDYSEDHPDAVSMAIIKHVHKKVNA